MNALITMTKAAKLLKKPTPFIYEMFNITGYFASYGTHGALCIINTLIDALNDNDHLPEYLIVVPDKNIMAGNASAYNSFVLGAILHYIIMQIDKYLARCRQDLVNKCTGSLAVEQTKIVWIWMPKCPNVETLEEQAFP